MISVERPRLKAELQTSVFAYVARQERYFVFAGHVHTHPFDSIILPLSVQFSACVSSAKNNGITADYADDADI